MKKVLFATTALVATASVAAADVRISGYGRFGLDYNDANDSDVNGASEVNLTSRLRLQFDMSTETDGGVALGARLRAQAENRDGNPGEALWNGPQFFVEYAGLRVNVGNIWGAIDNAPGLYLPTVSVGTGIDGMGFTSLPIIGAAWDSFISNGSGANGVEALYTAGGFVGQISYSQNNDTPANPDGVPVVDADGDPVANEFVTAPSAAENGEDRLAVMLTYSFDDYFVTGAYQSSSDGLTATNGEELNDGLWLIAAGADWGQFGAQLAYGQTEAADAITLAGNVDIGAASNLLVWVQNADSNGLVHADGPDAGDLVIADDGTSWGVNYQYDLGGGTTFVAGYVDSAVLDSQQFQAGVWFNF